jgi:phosphatidate cytidylyltransferase
MMEKNFQKRILSSLLLIPLSLFFIIKGSYYFILFLCVLFFIANIEWIRMNKKNEFKLLGFIILFLSFYSTFNLRTLNLEFFLLIVTICVATDMGGYIFGKFFKGPKLTKISPNKTYSGMFGSFLLSLIISYLFIRNYPILYFQNYLNYELKFVIFVLFTSSISQIGDLIISFFKRSSKVKNTGNILPGHGGLLDRIDGMIFVFPILYLINKFFS